MEIAGGGEILDAHEHFSCRMQAPWKQLASPWKHLASQRGINEKNRAKSIFMQQPAQCHYHQAFLKKAHTKVCSFQIFSIVLFSECKIRVKTRNENIFFGRFHIFTNSTPTTDILEKHKTTRATQTPSFCAKGEFQRWNRGKSPLKLRKITADVYFCKR